MWKEPKGIDIWDHIQEAGQETHPDKKQCVRGVHVFTCQECGAQISSRHYLNIGYFQIACKDHTCVEIANMNIDDEIPF